MSSAARLTTRTLGAATRAALLVTLVFGVAYTGVITGIGALVLPHQAGGQVVSSAGSPVGSALIGQPFTDTSGRPDPAYFQPRPSAAGANGYDAAASSGSNLGPENEDLVAAIDTARHQVAAFNDVPVDQVPADAVTASASGLDPDISPAYANIQAPRVATARGLDPERVTDLIAAHTRGRDLGFLGEERVNVLELNIALDQADPVGR